jgi:prepilin-type N-terminal cleavage/methylation domain-containing protein
MKRTSGQQRGFTIIEVLIVVAIIGIIVLIVFAAVPALNRNQRNYDRKRAVEYVASQMDDYYSSHNLRYPMSGTTPATDKRSSFSSMIGASGPTLKYNIRYSDPYGTHEYPYDLPTPSNALDEISIQPGHKCNTDPSKSPGSVDYPLQFAHGSDLDFRAYVVWTVMETGSGIGRVYCIDNGFD